MTFILPSFGASAIAAVPGGGGFSNDYALSYDGSDDYAQVTGLSLSGATSFSLWWNGQQATTNTVFPLLHQDSSNIFIDIGNNLFRVYLYDGTNGGYIYRQHSFVSPTQGQWYHFGITYDGTTNGSGLKTYIDGSLTGSGAVGGTFNSFNTQGSNPLIIGARGAGSYKQQLMDEVAIFGSELSATNISDIYNSGAPTDISSLSPKHWWRMGDSDTGVSNGSSTPTIVSNVGNSSAIQNHYALDFDGSDDFMDTGSNFTSTFTSAFTISCWFKRDNGSGTGAMFGQWHDGQYRHYAYVTGGSLIYDMRIGNTPVGAPTMSIAQDTNWHHVAVTVKQDSSNVLSSIYLDGVSGGTTTTAATLSNFVSTADWAVGKRNRPGGSEVPFAGLIDEVSIIGSALSDGGVSSGQTAGGDIATLYNNGVPADISSFSPVSWYRMGDNDSGTGTTITDQGSGSNDGTLTNGPTFSTNTPTANAILTNGPTYSTNVPT